MPVKYPDQKAEGGATCAYCGKTGLSHRQVFIRTKAVWSDPRNYCSMRCFAKGDRKIVALLTVLLVPLYIAFGVVVTLGSTLSYPPDPNWAYAGAGVFVVIALLIGLHTYCIYIGRQTDDTPYDERKDDWDGVRTYDLVE
ncbi:MAG: hypothetical protein RTU30_02260 [Candidatus Thorarchaeota archaeon]